MDENRIVNKYLDLYQELSLIIMESKKRVVANEPDSLFIENVNFYIKCYLITICTYLEAFLLEIAHDCSNKICSKIHQANIPNNFVRWRLSKTFKNELEYSNLILSLSKKDIADELSPNVEKTIILFERLGINLLREQDFIDHKEIVGSVVDKRNNIIHHNDDASDLSFNDLENYIICFSKYMKSINKAIDNSNLF